MNGQADPIYSYNLPKFTAHKSSKHVKIWQLPIISPTYNLPALGGGVTGAGFLSPLRGMSPPFCISLYCNLGETKLGLEFIEQLVDVASEPFDMNGLS